MTTTTRPAEHGSVVAAGSRVGAAGALAPLRARWDGLASRERVVLGAGALVVALVAVWMLAVQPAWQTLREAPPLRVQLDAQWQGERAVVAVQGVDGEALRRWLAEVRRGARAQPVELRLTRDGQGWRGSVVLALGGGG